MGVISAPCNLGSAPRGVSLYVKSEWRETPEMNKQPGFAAMIALFLGVVLGASIDASAAIDRHAVVTRHNITVTASSYLQVGNGEFALTPDITGLMSFNNGSILSHWGWHSNPLPAGKTLNDYQWPLHNSYTGRQIPYPLNDGSDIAGWMAKNPHAMNLGRLSLVLTKADGTAAKLTDILKPTQTLDLWKGLLTSRFTFDGQPVTVETCVHPTLDAVAVRITSPLISSGHLKIGLLFPYPNESEFGDTANVDGHATTMAVRGYRRVDFARKADADTYNVGLAWAADGAVTSPSKHNYLLSPASASQFEFICAFASQPLQDSLPSVTSALAACAAGWAAFWNSGGAIDLSASKDARWMELERRIVLSQYLMAADEAGSYPPAESGLKKGDSWYGRFHFEMTWWHGMHYAMWDRWPLLNRYLGIYRKYLPGAQANAEKEGYKGARWFKCTGNVPVEWPGTWHAWLTWQNPHPIFFAEMDYRAHPTLETLNKWRDVVLNTADFLATFPSQDKANPNRMVLGNPIMDVSEHNNVDATTNPAFDIGYWRFGLRIAQQWRQRLGLAQDTLYANVLNRLAPMPIQDSVYVEWEGMTNMWTGFNSGHPALIGTYGMLPGDGVDVPTMRRTFAKVMATWQLDKMWGWDFPLLAMCAARLGQPDKAVDLLLNANYAFPASGINSGSYFPGNGALLYAVAMMAAGWDNGPKKNAPGFPSDGSWTVAWEGLKPAPALEDAKPTATMGATGLSASTLHVSEHQGEALIAYTIGSGEALRDIRVYTLSGSCIRTYASGIPASGGRSGVIRWNRMTSAKAWAGAGTYIIRLKTDRGSLSAKMAMP